MVLGRQSTPGRSDALVLFGATGDLAKKKLFPALYHLTEGDRLEMPIVGVAASDWSDDQFRAHVRESVEAAVRDGIDIVPSVSVIREWDRPHRMADTERGEQFRCDIEMLERLIELYRNNELRQDEWRQTVRS